MLDEGRELNVTLCSKAAGESGRWTHLGPLIPDPTSMTTIRRKNLNKDAVSAG